MSGYKKGDITMKNYVLKQIKRTVQCGKEFDHSVLSNAEFRES